MAGTSPAMTAMATIYKILPQSLWQDAVHAGGFRGSDVDRRDGYIHFSTASQVKETAEKHFAGQHDLLLLQINAEALGGNLKWEPSRGGAPFPHYYGELDPRTVSRVDLLTLG